MKDYNIVLAHGPVTETEYIGNDTVLFTLEDGRKYSIRFSIETRADGKLYCREVHDGRGLSICDRTEFDVFGEGLTTEDYAQWTADNFCEIEELVESEGY